MKNAKPIMLLGGLAAAAFFLGRREGAAEVASAGRLSTADGFFYYEVAPSLEGSEMPFSVYLSPMFAESPPAERDPAIEMAEIAGVETESDGLEFVEGYAEQIL
jgi:hypothetical protein